MALKIRLRQQGRRNHATFRLVVTDVRAPRDGKYVEAIGWYDPSEADAEKGMTLKIDRLQYWMGLGAQLSENSESLIARIAPEFIRELTEKRLAARAKVTAKRKASRKKAVA